jgi:hypothetical protein
MTFIVDGTNGATFPDSSTQAKAGLVVGTASAITAGTSVASTSGTTITFTSIPSWVKRITLIFNSVSTNGSSNPMVQIGSGSLLTSGYLGAAGNASNNTATSGANFTTGFGILSGMASNVIFQSTMVITNITGNTWVASGCGGCSDGARFIVGGGAVSLSGTLDRVALTTVNGTDAFDNGSVNIFYE